MRSRGIRFVRGSIMAQGGHSNKRWTFKWTRHLYRSFSKSEFEKWIPADRPAIEKAALDFLSCAN